MSYCPHDDDPTTCPPCNRHLKVQVEVDRSAITADYSSACPACPYQIEVGSPIVKQDGEWIHAECGDAWRL